MNDKELREVRKRFRPDQNNISHIRGCFVNEKKEIVTEFKESLALCPQEETESLLAIMKKTLSGSLGTNLIDLKFRTEQVRESDEHALLMALKRSELSDDGAVHELFFRIKENVTLGGNYVILLAFDKYDYFEYGKDGEKNEDSFGVYNFFVCSICPIKHMKSAVSFHAYDNTFHTLSSDSLIGAPELGFIFPAFEDRQENIYGSLYYTHDITKNHTDFVKRIFDLELPMPAAVQKETFDECLSETMSGGCDFELLCSVQEQISEMIEEHKEEKSAEPLRVSKNEIKNTLKYCGIEEEKLEEFDKLYDEQFGEKTEVAPQNIVDVKKLEVKMPDVTIKVNPKRRDLVSTQIINGAKYILIKADENVSVNGIDIKIN